MEIPETLFAHIKNEARSVQHGRVTIEINESAGKIDVVTESRKRWSSKEGQLRPVAGEHVNRGKRVFRSG